MRTQQKERTRAAIVDATRALAAGGGEVTMPAIAVAARVSEATAYRYFPDLLSLLRETLDVLDPVEALAPVAGSDDVVERVGYAAAVLARDVLRRQGAVRAAFAGSITRPGAAATARPGRRFGLIDAALASWEATDEAREQLVRDLAVVLSAEALFILVDLYGFDDEQAVASLVGTARRVTAAATPGSTRSRSA